MIFGIRTVSGWSDSAVKQPICLFAFHGLCFRQKDEGNAAAATGIVAGGLHHMTVGTGEQILGAERKFDG